MPISEFFKETDFNLSPTSFHISYMDREYQEEMKILCNPENFLGVKFNSEDFLDSDDCSQSKKIKVEYKENSTESSFFENSLKSRREQFSREFYNPTCNMDSAAEDLLSNESIEQVKSKAKSLKVSGPPKTLCLSEESIQTCLQSGESNPFSIYSYSPDQSKTKLCFNIIKTVRKNEKHEKNKLLQNKTKRTEKIKAYCSLKETFDVQAVEAEFDKNFFSEEKNKKQKRIIKKNKKQKNTETEVKYREGPEYALISEDLLSSIILQFYNKPLLIISKKKG